MSKKERFNKICADYNILSAYIFGSMSKEGSAILNGKKTKKISPLADIDIGVVFLKGKLNLRERIKTYGRLYSELSDIFSPFTLDLVFLQETGVIVQFEAINGILIYSHDEDMRLDYEERVIKFYQDWKPDYEQYTKEVLEAVTT
jgi:predicted nucleotidyltransferase